MSFLRSDNEAKRPGEILTEEAVKTTVQILYDRRLFNRFDNAGKSIIRLSIFRK